jgi:GH24 family phage-related lysozyme (muramidase)
VKVATVNPATFVTLRNISTTTGYVATGQVFCTVCHKAPYAIPHPTNLNAGVTCAKCHTDPLGQNTGTGDAHSIQPLPRCIDCHAVQQAQVAPGLVNDNSGVRSITQEFAKWSHHVTGVTLNDAHCAACHLEGKVSGTEIAVDSTKHMVDGMVHLRNADTDADMQWDPASPNHTTMDNFCMSCHDANGATSAMSVNIQAFINTNGIAATGKTASAKNPFGDTISNRYDKMQRPGVTNVGDQFNTSNNSHHGVKGPRYSGRTRVAGSRAIANPGTFANNSSATLQGVRSTIYDAGNFNQLYTPLANNGGETAPRTGAATLGDDSTLHCGDCHTVGQWKAGSSTIASGAPTPVAIGAHGSNNEYLLRNSIGTDQRHTQNAYTVSGTNVVTQTNPNGAFLVCYNCHAYKNYGSTYVGTGANAGNIAGAELANNQPHAGEYDTGGRCNAPGNTLSFAGYTTGAATDGSQFASRIDGLGAKLTGEQAPDGNVSGNIFGIQCLNCHNSGIGNAYGGIHGSANDTSWNGVTPASLDGNATGGYYINGMGNATKVERFLPGLGNAMHVPGTLGGITGGTTVPSGTNGVAYSFTTGGVTNDTNWEQKHWQQTATTVINFKTAVVTNTASAGAGCYTLGGTTPIATNVSAGLSGPSVTGEGGSATAASDTWGGCEDHSAAQGGGNHGFLKRIVRPVTY